MTRQCEYGEFAAAGHRCPNQAVYVHQIPGEPRPFYACAERMHRAWDRYGNVIDVPIADFVPPPRPTE